MNEAERIRNLFFADFRRFLPLHRKPTSPRRRLAAVFILFRFRLTSDFRFRSLSHFRFSDFRRRAPSDFRFRRLYDFRLRTCFIFSALSTRRLRPFSVPPFPDSFLNGSPEVIGLVVVGKVEAHHFRFPLERVKSFGRGQVLDFLVEFFVQNNAFVVNVDDL